MGPRLRPESLPSTSRPTGERSFRERVEAGFTSRASAYEREATLQRAVAWRLAHLCRDLSLPEGPCADLGAGTGLLSRALELQRAGLSLLRLDACPALLLQREQQGGEAALVWDLNEGLPPRLQEAALLASSFALHWLEHPQQQLSHWCQRLRPGGWLALAVPTAGSHPQWRQAARGAGVPCTALPLPQAEELLAAAAGSLELRRAMRLRFSHTAPSGLALLRRIRALGAGTSRTRSLAAGEWRRLEAHWPAESRRPEGNGPGGKRLTWEVLLLLGRRPLALPSTSLS